MQTFKNVLLIDDSYIDLFITRAYLEKFGIAASISTTESGLEALSFIKNPDNAFPDIIFLDIKMPEMDGFEFLDEFDKLLDEKKTQCIIYMLSSSQDPRDKEKSYAHPFVKNFISKPLTKEILVTLFGKA